MHVCGNFSFVAAVDIFAALVAAAMDVVSAVSCCCTLHKLSTNS